MDRSIRVVLRANVADFNAQIKSSSRTLDDLVQKADKGGKVADTALGRMAQSARYQRESWSALSNTMLASAALMSAGLGVAVKRFADFDEKMSHVQAVTHETAANMGLLREAAIQAGADTAYSATEAAAAIEELAKAGISTRDILDGGLDGALSLAAAGGLEVADAAGIASIALNQFKLQGKDVGHVADLLAAGAGKAMGSVHDLGMALKQGGLVASQTGLSIEETSAGLAAFAANGLLGSDAGTSFKTMLQRLTPQSKKAAQLMDELNLHAYDAQGNFVGLAAYAGRLRAALKDMSDEQRNAALNTLFGADAIRAAGILYAEGEKGVNGWIKKVNDSGYAAKTAAARMDNLKGDLEKLSGSLETAFIKSGSGANKVLRSLVQGLDLLVDTLGSVSPETLQVVAGIAALTAGNLAARGAVMKLLPAILDLKAAWNGLDTVLPTVTRMSSGLGNIRGGLSATRESVRSFGDSWAVARAAGVSNMQALKQGVTPIFGGLTQSAKGFGGALLGAVGGPVGLAVTAGVTVLTYALMSYTEAQAQANAEAEEYAATLDSAGKATTRAARELIASKLQEHDAFPAFKTLGIDARLAVDAIQGVEGAHTKFMATLDRLDRENAQRRKELISSRGNTVSANDPTITEINREAEAIRKLRSVYEEQSGSIAKAARDKLDLADASAESTAAVGDEARAMAEAAEAAEAQANAITELIKAQSELAGIVLSVRQAERNFQDAIDDVSASLEKNGQTLDVTTEAGRANEAALDDIAKASWTLIESLNANGATNDELQASMARSRQAFVDAAIQMGLNEQQANELADALHLIPDEVKTQVSTPGADTAKQKLGEVDSAARNVKGSVHVSVNYSDVYGAIGALQQLQAEINASGGHTRVAYGQGGRGGSVVGYAGGGAVKGPGTGTSDSIIARLSNNEHVFTASDVHKAGGHEAIYRIRAAIQGGYLPQFVGGGPVGRSVPVPVPARAGVGVTRVEVSTPQTVTLVDRDGTFLGKLQAVARDESIQVVREVI